MCWFIGYVYPGEVSYLGICLCALGMGEWYPGGLDPDWTKKDPGLGNYWFDLAVFPSERELLR